MKLVAASSPYIRKNVSVARMMADVIIALMPVTLFAIIINGIYGNAWNAIYVLLLSVCTMVGLELIIHGMIHWPKGMKFKELFTKEGFAKIKASYTINNILAPVISGLIFALIMPSGCDWYVIFLGAIFGIVVGKMVFGGLGSNIFNPAATGRIFASLCFGAKINAANLSIGSQTVASATALGSAKGQLSNMTFSLLDLFMGNVPGTMGEVSVLLILVGGIYLFARRSGDLRAALSYLLSFAFVMLIAAISYLKVNSSVNPFEVWAYQLFSGGVFFAAVFMITDPVTSPTSKFGRIAYGTAAGCITALIRLCGAYPEGAAFSILIANLLAPCIDHFMRGKKNTYTWVQCLVLGVSVVAISLIAMGVVFTTFA